MINGRTMDEWKEGSINEGRINTADKSDTAD